MATRIFRLYGTHAGNDIIQLTNSPLAPPSGVKWTIVQLDVAMGDVGHVQGFFDTELYHDIDEEDTVQFGKPQTLALDIVQPHKYVVNSIDTSGNTPTTKVTIVVEESSLGGQVAQ